MPGETASCGRAGRRAVPSADHQESLDGRSSWSLREVAAERYGVYSGGQEGAEGVDRRADDRLAVVERGVEDQRHAGQVGERRDQLVVARVVRGIDGLDPGGAVDVEHRR